MCGSGFGDGDSSVFVSGVLIAGMVWREVCTEA